jgi:hypothetical protein
MAFDRWDFEEKIKECFDPRKLYLLSEDLARLKKDGFIGDVIYDELSNVIIEKIAGIEEVRRQVIASERRVR